MQFEVDPVPPGRALRVTVGGHAPVAVRPGQTVLAALREAGSRALPVGCRGGGCGVCRVRVVSGEVRVGAMSAAVVSAAEARAGLALACRIVPLSDCELAPEPLARGVKARAA